MRQLDRRQFVTWSAGGALLLGLSAGHALADAPPLSPWIRIDPDGKVTLFTTVSEMGQGAKTGQAQVLADELDVPWESVVVEQGQPAESGPFARMGTGGSSSIRRYWKDLRAAGASVRAQLITAAARRWNCAESECVAELGVVRRASAGASLPYGALAADAAACAAPAAPPFKPVAQRRYIGKPLSTLENADKSAGKAIYGVDVRRPGLLFASIAASPVFGGKLASVDEAPAVAVAGVKKVVKLDNAVAVIATNTWSAFKGVRALQPQWSTPDIASTSADISKRLHDALSGDGVAVDNRDMRTTLRSAFAKAARQVEATYETAHLYHAALEPMNTTVQVGADKVEVWSPTQVPTATRAAVAGALGRPVGQVVFHNTLLGGGYGRRLIPDFAVFAARVAAEADGAPVMLIWTREEDVTHDFYRRASVTRFRAGLPLGGVIDGYELICAGADQTLNGGDPAPYGLKRFAASQATVRTGIPQGPWRSVDPGLVSFGRESFIDECAHAAKMDPLAYRRALLTDNPRAKRVLDAAATALGWGGAKAKGIGHGLALVESFGSLVATAMEVTVDGQALNVTRIAVAADVGTAVNPQQVKAQLEGGATMGLSAALGEAMTFTGGKADQGNFNAYKLLRMRQAPKIEVTLLDSPDAALGGAGEPGVPGIAPALANAVFDATGKRVRTLPFSGQGFTV